MQPARPVITIGGLSNMTLTPAELTIGYLIFKDIEISIKQEDDEDDDEDDIEDDNNDDDDDDDNDNGDSANKVIHQQSKYSIGSMQNITMIREMEFRDLNSNSNQENLWVESAWRND